METNNQFKRNGILIGHDTEKQTLLFAYKGETPTLMGTYYLVHNSELHQLRKDIESMLYTIAEMQEIFQLQDELITKQRRYIADLENGFLSI